MTYSKLHIILQAQETFTKNELYCIQNHKAEAVTKISS